MAKTVKKESGGPTVEQPERGDPRLHVEPVEKARDAGAVKKQSQDQAPASRRDRKSPWMGGG